MFSAGGNLEVGFGVGPCAVELAGPAVAVCCCDPHPVAAGPAGSAVGAFGLGAL